MRFITSMASWLFGGASGSGGAGKVVDALDKAILSKQERFEMDAADMISVRAMFSAPAGPGFLNQLIDAVNRSVRPLVTYALIGGLMGWWKLPSMDAVAPFYQTLIYLVFTFWFGGRAIMKDVPAMLTALKKIKRKYTPEEN